MKFKAIRTAVSRISPRFAHEVMYRRVMGRGCDLDSPTTFNEKISWLKLNELPKDPLAARVTDKYRVRDWVAEKGFADTLVGFYGVWDDAEAVPYGELPNRFVLKCNHGCGMSIISPDKAEFDVADAKKRLGEWMRTDWSLLSAEPHYGSIPRRIICEEYVEGPLSDYKFYCFGGEPAYYYVSQGLEDGPAAGRISFFALRGGGAAPFIRTDHAPLEPPYPARPSYFGRMEEMARALSKPFKFARIDFLTNPGGFWFSEVTLTPSAGMMPIEPLEWDCRLGELIRL